MNRTKISIAVIAFVLMFCSGGGFSQSIAQPGVQQGVELFYSARFEEAAQNLQSAVINGTLTPAELYTAHLFIAFSRIRQNADQETIRLNLEAAIKADPTQELDPIKTPPDLFDQYSNVRNTMLGHLAVFSYPPGASILLMEPGQGKLMNEYSPFIFSSLLAGEYQLVIAKDGFVTMTQTIALTPGQQDTVIFELAPKRAITNKVNKKWLAWGGGGLALATAIIASVPWGGEEEKPKPQLDLPLPPARPGKP